MANNRYVARMIRSALMLASVAVIGTALLAGVHELTRDRIAAQERRVVLEQLNQVLPAKLYDNALHEDFIEIHEPVFFRHDDKIRIYRARTRGQPVAAVLNLVAGDGYNGDIRLLVAILNNGLISGVRVIAHRETPGLGDPIERKRSDWILGFDGQSLQNPAIDGWAVRRDGGVFDQFTGATITPRAVVEAVQRALEYFAANQDRILEAGSIVEHHAPDR
jgi:electron transport complex protein RnfG